MLVFKVLRAPEWADLQARRQSAGAAVDVADGYIHLSTAAQLEGTLSRHFAGEQGLVLLACDDRAMAGDLRWEPSRGGDLFPHLYRDIRLSDVVWWRTVPPTKDRQTGWLE